LRGVPHVHGSFFECVRQTRRQTALKQTTRVNLTAFGSYRHSPSKAARCKASEDTEKAVVLSRLQGLGEGRGLLVGRNAECV
jgi:hypothetical protein